SAAFKKGALSQQQYAEMIATTTLLNRIGADLAKDAAVHAMTDVTGFGLIGHALEVARGSKQKLIIWHENVPLLTAASSLARDGFVTRASGRNWASYSPSVELPEHFPECAPRSAHRSTDVGRPSHCLRDRASAILQTIANDGYLSAQIIG